SLITMLTDRDEDDPWLPQHLVWPLLEVIDESLGEPWCDALSRHLGHGSEDADLLEVRAGWRYSVGLRLARLLHRYGQSRPGMLTDWAHGRATDGTGPLDPDLIWQPELWRRLVARLAAPAPDARHRQTVARLLALDEGSPDAPTTGAPAELDLRLLPSRLSLFGHTRLSVT